ncbi:helix-turn-helix domain-containing protein [Desulfocurvibacter africanus]|uniref:Helix-turn-helix domain protein n=1 Tax=Desulfocurvibacter africanus subsp. africanus str. Walvis Bay TaxID=690850 RepID=F3YZ97_DESAF|nr:helix-turn-helix transcriptional regulator [Desulfocurvibacter africanus]EGJ50853.1 helix-turn-helix domain protein [Desulfocurvibacter africanus subsp. africanus str. Walvis Bay]
MSAPTTKHQVVEHEGKTLYVLVPVEEYRELERLRAGEEPTYPHEVVERLTEGKSLVRAWREYRGLTQEDMATRLGITIPAYQRMEQPGRNLRLGTLKRLAKALEVRVDHLILDDDEDEDAA